MLLKKTLSAIILFSFLSFFSETTLAQQTILASGANISNATGSVSYSIGQIVCDNVVNTTGEICQGIQYPYDLYKVGGQFKTPNNKPITKVTSWYNSNSKLQANNSYDINLSNGNYTLRPTKNNDITKANGVTSVDVLLTQRHILNTTKLNSAYKIIAADVNGDKAINSVDILRMKRLILGTDTTFTSTLRGSRLWEFIDSAYQFPDTTNPFPFKDSILFINLTSNKTNQTFIGVKLGDVNYDWNPAVAKGINDKTLELQYSIDNKQLNIGDNLIKIPITTKNFKDIVAIQYTLHFDNSNYEFVGIENNKLNIDFNEKQVSSNGHIAMLWTDKNAEPKTLEDGTELFVLVLRSNVNSTLSTDLTLTNEITETEAWDKDFNQHNIILSKRTTKNELTKTNESFSFSPNPTNGEIRVNLVANTNKIITLELTDIQGKPIFKQAVGLQKGNNNLILNLKQNTNILTGIYFIKAVGIEGGNMRIIILR